MRQNVQTKFLTNEDKKVLVDPDLSVDEYFRTFVTDYGEGKLSKEMYLEIEAYYLSHNPNRQDIENLRRRLDSRTVFEFARDLKKHTEKETFLANLFVAEMRLWGYKVDLKDFGVDNFGGFVGKAKREIARSDFLVQIDGKGWTPAEIKNSPSPRKVTLKVSNLKSYIEQNSLMILFYGTGRLENDCLVINRKETRWALLSSAEIRKILENITHRRYWEVGNKMGVQLTPRNFDEYFISRKLRSVE